MPAALLLVLLSAVAQAKGQTAQRPNILLIMSDDLGHADLSYVQGNKQTPTPNIDKLAYDGIILDRHYSTSICTPSRASLMTGQYINQLGIPHTGLGMGEPWGIPLDVKLMPEYFKNLGYETSLIGKWHLGDHQRAFFPDRRGFDYAFTFPHGESNFFNYTSGWISPIPISGRQLREHGKIIPANHTNNYYLPTLIVDKAIQVIRNSDPQKPWFMYFSTPLVHTAVDDLTSVMHTMNTYQLRPAVYSLSEKFPERKRYLSMIQHLDDNYKQLIDAVVNKGVADNTIVVSLADGGAPVFPGSFFVHGSNYGSNWPLRHGKGAFFEGGIRTPAFIWSPLLKKRGRITKQLIGLADWLPTLYEAAGGDVKDLTAAGVTGVSHWHSFQLGLPYGPRTELPNIIDVRHRPTSHLTFLYEDSYGTLYKLCSGNVIDNSFFGWWRTDGTVEGDDSWRVWTPTSVNCNFPEGKEVNKCEPHKRPCLFDLTNDPCETNNIYDSYPSMVKLMRQRIDFYNATSRANVARPFDPASNPANWGGIWAPWQDPVEVLDKEPLTYAPFNPSTSF